METYSTQNLFARELAAALEQHGATLEDLQRAPLRVHRITIKRLRNALSGRVPPKGPKLSMLSPDTVSHHTVVVCSARQAASLPWERKPIPH
jgi:hypothetical protein